jgi:glycosyltransferase involved in cell wall biosynthesis
MPKKILIVSVPPYSVGGIETMLRWFYRKCVDSGWLSPTVLSVVRKLPQEYPWSDGKRLNNDLENTRLFNIDGIETIIVKSDSRHPLYRAREMRQCLEQISSEYSVICLVSGTAILGISLAELRLPYITWTATTLDSEELSKGFGDFSLKIAWKQLRYYFRRSQLRKAEYSVLERSKHNFVISPFTYDSISQEYPALKPQTSILPIPIEISNSVVCCETIESRIVWAGRPSDPRKDLPTLYRAFRLVSDVNPEARLAIMGGTVPEGLRTLAQELGIDSRIDYLGRVENPSSEFNRADVAVISSLQEGQCLALLEAMSLGVPPISTKCGGPEDFIIDGTNGLLVEKRDHKSLSAAITRLIKDRQLRRKLGDAARQTVLNDFSPDSAFSKLARAFGSDS